MFASKTLWFVAATICLAGCGVSGSSGTTSTSSAASDGNVPPPASAVTLDGDIHFDISTADSHPHYHGAYYVQDPEFHFPLVNTSSTTVNVPYTIRMDGVDIPGYGSPRHALTVPAHGSIDGNAFQNPYDTGLNPGAGPRPSGTHVFSVVIDPDDMLHETNEGNNVFATQIAVPTTNHTYPIAAGDLRPDLQFVDPHIHGPAAQNLIVHFVVKNNNPNAGASASSPCHWKLMREGAVVSPTVTTGQADMSIPALAQGAETTIVASITEAMTTGEVKYTIVIDSQNEEPNEVYEDNNSVDRWVAMGSPSAN